MQSAFNCADWPWSKAVIVKQADNWSLIFSPCSQGEAVLNRLAELSGNLSVRIAVNTPQEKQPRHDLRLLNDSGDSWLLFERHTCRGQTDLSCLSYYEISLIHILWCLTVCGTSYDVCEPLIDTCVKLVGCDGSYLAATLTVTLVLQHTTMHKHHFLFLFLCFCFLVHKTDKHSDLQNGLFWDTEYHFLLSKII